MITIISKGYRRQIISKTNSHTNYTVQCGKLWEGRWGETSCLTRGEKFATLSDCRLKGVHMSYCSSNLQTQTNSIFSLCLPLSHILSCLSSLFCLRSIRYIFLVICWIKSKSSDRRYLEFFWVARATGDCKWICDMVAERSIVSMFLDCHQLYSIVA